MFNFLGKTKKQKIFCISIQRTGTTSVGDFFEKHNYRRAGWYHSKENNWGKLYFDGNYEAIFSSMDFKNNDVFENGPESIGHFYKYLFHRFPNSIFILLTRDSDKWFNSMMSHSKGKTLGNTFRHCYIYQRETEYYNVFGEKHDYNQNKIDNLLPLTEEYRQHYKDVYENRNRHCIDFFKSQDHNNSRFIHLDLEDNDKWKKIAAFVGFNVDEEFDVHSNKSLN